MLVPEQIDLIIQSYRNQDVKALYTIFAPHFSDPSYEGWGFVKGELDFLFQELRFTSLLSYIRAKVNYSVEDKLKHLILQSILNGALDPIPSGFHPRFSTSDFFTLCKSNQNPALLSTDIYIVQQTLGEKFDYDKVYYLINLYYFLIGSEAMDFIALLSYNQPDPDTLSVLSYDTSYDTNTNMVTLSLQHRTDVSKGEVVKTFPLFIYLIKPERPLEYAPSQAHVVKVSYYKDSWFYSRDSWPQVFNT